MVDDSDEEMFGRLSAWELLMNPDRTRVFQPGVCHGLRELNKFASDLYPRPGSNRQGDIKLYRIDTLDHILSAIQRKKLWLPRPTAWEDPWEDPVWRHLETTHAAYAKTIKFDCFALCWTMEPSCEAHWRRLKDKGRLVRIETTVEKLLSSVLFNADELTIGAQEQVFLNKMHYMKPKEEKDYRREINAILNNEFPAVESDLVRISSLFAKRNSFEYEREYRLVFRIPRPKSNSGITDHYELNIDPATMIESVQLDPWCGDCEYRMIKKTFTDLGYTCTKSDLAKPMWDEESSSA